MTGQTVKLLIIRDGSIDISTHKLSTIFTVRCSVQDELSRLGLSEYLEDVLRPPDETDGARLEARWSVSTTTLSEFSTCPGGWPEAEYSLWGVATSLGRESDVPWHVRLDLITTTALKDCQASIPCGPPVCAQKSAPQLCAYASPLANHSEVIIVDLPIFDARFQQKFLEPLTDENLSSSATPTSNGGTPARHTGSRSIISAALSQAKLVTAQLTPSFIGKLWQKLSQLVGDSATKLKRYCTCGARWPLRMIVAFLLTRLAITLLGPTGYSILGIYGAAFAAQYIMGGLSNRLLLAFDRRRSSDGGTQFNAVFVDESRLQGRPPLALGPPGTCEDTNSDNDSSEEPQCRGQFTSTCATPTRVETGDDASPKSGEPAGFQIV